MAIKTKREMTKMAKSLNFIEANKLKEQLRKIEENIKKGQKNSELNARYTLYYKMLIKRLQYF